MEITEKHYVEQSGVSQIGPNLFVVYVKNERGEKVRILDGPVGIGVSVDVQIDEIPRLLGELENVHRAVFKIRREALHA